MSAEQEAETALAYTRLFNDNPSKGDAELVIADIVRKFGLFGPPSVEDWIKRYATASGYETRLHERNGAFAVYEHIKSSAGLTREQIVRLEQIVRYGVAD